MSNLQKKSFELFKQKSDLTQYFGEPKMDLYVDVSRLEERDSMIFEFLKQEPSFILKPKPIIKTEKQEYYDEIFAKYFNRE